VHVTPPDVIDPEIAQRQINVLRSLIDGMPVVMRCRNGSAWTVVGDRAVAHYALDPQIDVRPVLQLALAPEPRPAALPLRPAAAVAA